MAKKNKSHKNFNVEIPEVYNMDDIGYMPDEALRERYARLDSERGRLAANGYDPRLWEVELAYVQREQGIRMSRSELHADYIRKFQANHEDLDFSFVGDHSQDELN
jgi:hypothetical protein